MPIILRHASSPDRLPREPDRCPHCRQPGPFDFHRETWTWTSQVRGQLAGRHQIVVPAMSAARRHLNVIFQGCERGLVELRALPTGEQAWTEIGDWSRLGPFVTRAVRNRRSVLVGLATRRDTTSGGEQNICELSSLFVDIETPPEITRTRLKEFPFRCALVIGSGLGSHVYWRLKEPLDVSNAAELARTASLMRRLSGYLGGDPRATSPAIAPRLASSFNFKYGDPRPVTLIDESDHALNPSELEDFLPAETVRRGQYTLTPSFLVGTRNDSLYLVIRSMHPRGVPYAEIDKQVRTLNETQCEVPLPEAEINTLLKYAGQRQRNRPDFRGPLPKAVIVHDAPQRKERA